ncbi:MAG: hypothetical protein ABL888_12345 [Pirellulaceae bacterium]
MDENRDVLNDLPEYSWQLDRLSKATRARDIVTWCSLIGEREDEYESTAISSIKEAAAELPEKKERAYSSLRRLATFAIQLLKEDKEVHPGLSWV